MHAVYVTRMHDTATHVRSKMSNLPLSHFSFFSQWIWTAFFFDKLGLVLTQIFFSLWLLFQHPMPFNLGVEPGAICYTLS